MWRGDIRMHLLDESNHPCDGIAILPPTTVVQVKEESYAWLELVLRSREATCLLLGPKAGQYCFISSINLISQKSH
jgi:hypothetical protein